MTLTDFFSVLLSREFPFVEFSKYIFDNESCVSQDDVKNSVKDGGRRWFHYRIGQLQEQSQVRFGHWVMPRRTFGRLKELAICTWCNTQFSVGDKHQNRSARCKRNENIPRNADQLRYLYQSTNKANQRVGQFGQHFSSVRWKTHEAMQLTTQYNIYRWWCIPRNADQLGYLYQSTNKANQRVSQFGQHFSSVHIINTAPMYVPHL